MNPRRISIVFVAWMYLFIPMPASGQTVQNFPAAIGILSAQKLACEQWAKEWKSLIQRHETENLALQKKYEQTNATGLQLRAHERDSAQELAVASRTYGFARASYERFVQQTIAQITLGQDFEQTEDFKNALTLATQSGDRFIKIAEHYVTNPNAPLDTTNTEFKENALGLVSEAIGPVINAFKEIWLFYKKSEQDTRNHLISQIGALKFLEFEKI